MDFWPDDNAQWAVGSDAGLIRQGRFPAELTPAQMRQDVDYLMDCIFGVHPDPYTIVSKKEWESARRRLMSDVSTGPKTRLEFYRLVAPVVARMHEAHTNVWPPTEEHPGTEFPCQIDVNNLGCFITSSHSPDLAQGAAIEAINGLPMSRIWEDLLAYQGDERRLSAQARFALDMSWWLYLKYGWEGPYRICLRVPGGDQMKVERKVAAAQIFPERGDTCLPEVRWRLLPETSTAVLVVDSFSYDPPFCQQMADAFAAFRKAGVKNLIIDIRNNPGGQQPAAALLLRYLDHREIRFIREDWCYLSPFPDSARFSGKVYLLIGPRTESMASAFAGVFKGDGVGTILGGTTGCPYRCFGSCISTQLPQSKLLMSVSQDMTTSVYTTFANANDGVEPDVEVANSGADYAVNRDAAMDAALGIITHGRK